MTWIIHVGDEKNPATKQDLDKIKTAIDKDATFVVSRVPVKMYKLESGEYPAHINSYNEQEQAMHTIFLVCILIIAIILLALEIGVVC